MNVKLGGTLQWIRGGGGGEEILLGFSFQRNQSYNQLTTLVPCFLLEFSS